MLSRYLLKSNNVVNHKFVEKVTFCKFSRGRAQGEMVSSPGSSESQDSFSRAKQPLAGTTPELYGIHTL